MKFAATTSLAAICLALLLCACNVVEAHRDVAARRMLGAAGKGMLGAIAGAKTNDRAPDSNVELEPLLVAESRPDAIAPEPEGDPLKALESYHTSAIADARAKAAALTVAPRSATVLQPEAVASFNKKCSERVRQRTAAGHPALRSPELVVCPLTRTAGPSTRT